MKNEGWSVYRNGYITEWGEWRPTGSWNAYKDLIYPHLTYKVYIFSRGRRGYGPRPYRWIGRLTLSCHRNSSELGRLEIPTTHPSCNSIADALRHADAALDEEKHVAELMQKVYQRDNVRFCAWWKRHGEEEFQPFLSVFGTSWVDNYLFPHGEIIGANLRFPFAGPPDIVFTRTTRTAGGWSSGGLRNEKGVRVPPQLWGFFADVDKMHRGETEI